jgi:hypothetical protein
MGNRRIDRNISPASHAEVSILAGFFGQSRAVFFILSAVCRSDAASPTSPQPVPVPDAIIENAPMS